MLSLLFRVSSMKRNVWFRTSSFWSKIIFFLTVFYYLIVCFLPVITQIVDADWFPLIWNLLTCAIDYSHYFVCYYELQVLFLLIWRKILRRNIRHPKINRPLFLLGPSTQIANACFAQIIKLITNFSKIWKVKK